jgi:hypothetical protein
LMSQLQLQKSLHHRHQSIELLLWVLIVALQVWFYLQFSKRYFKNFVCLLLSNYVFLL